MQPAELERICQTLTHLSLTSKIKVIELSSFEKKKKNAISHISLTDIDYYLSKWKARWSHVSTLDSGSSGLGSGPARGHCVVFLGKKLYSHSAPLHPGV